MWISDFAIRKPVVTTVVVLAMVVFGAAAWFVLPTDEYPEVDPPVVNVAIPYPGASPSVVERELVEPLEDAFSSIPGVEEIRSVATDGHATITVEFDFEKDLVEASQDVRDKISEVRDELPPEIEEPVLTRFDPNDLPIVSLTLSSRQRSPAELTRLADPAVTSALRALPGVADVVVVGGVEREIVVELEPPALRAAHLGVADVARALEAANVAAPVGRLSGPLEERTIRLRGRLSSPADFERIVVSREGGRIVRLGDVARVIDGAEEPRSGALFDGAPAVGIDVKKATGHSTTDVSERILGEVETLRRGLPRDVELSVVRDAGTRVERSVKNVQRSLLEGAALTLLVVFVFLKSWRSTVITGLALPVSVLASFIAVWAFGFTLNTMSLLGLSLAIGILIDDAIVVRENIVRHMEMGKDHARAAREGTSEIGLAVTATTFSIVVVFVPIAFMGGIAEQWFAPFALTIACAVLVSLLVSFSLDPMLSASWSDPEITGGRRTWLSRRLDPFDRWFDRQTARYQKLVAWALGHRIATIAIAGGVFAGALALPALGVVGSAFLPAQDRSELTIHVETPPGANLEYTRLKAEEAARLARRLPEVAYTYTTVGGATGGVEEGDVYVRLVPRAARRRSQAEIERVLRDEIRRIGGATAFLVSGGFGRDKQIEVQLTGPDLEVLGELAARVEAVVRNVPGAVDIGLSTHGLKPEIDVRLDRDLAGSLGVTLGDVAQALRLAFSGIDVGDWIDPEGETRDVTIRLAPEARVSAEDLSELPIALPPAPEDPAAPPRVVPLGQIARIEAGLGPARIEHLDRRRVVTVGANTQGRALSEVVGDLERALSAVTFPPGYAMTFGGETESQTEVFGRILAALAVAVWLMYFVLVVQFESFLDPLAILASLPLSLIGVMLALLVTGSTLDLMSMIGVVLLMGIVAKNAILLIDFAKRAQARGLARKAALIEAGAVRLRPIVMTSVAIVAGMLPVALGHGEGGDFRAPLGRAVIGGVITSTLLTLLFIPAFYDLLATARARLWDPGTSRTNS